MIVTADAIRPAGRKDECFYCNAKLGSEHEYKCVLLVRSVPVRITIDIELEYPVSWDNDSIEFHANESSSCANNLLTRIQEYADRVDAENGCMCQKVSLEVRDVPAVENP